MLISLKSISSKHWIVAIIAFSIVLRFNHIDQPYVDVFSWRQTSTAMMADNYYRTNWNIFFPEVSWGGPGPNYQGREFQTVSYISALLYTIFGQQDWIGRSVAAAFGVWGIFALYQLVRRVWDEESALVSAAVMAILPGGIFIDRSFLPDPVMVALMVTSLWMLAVHSQTGSRRALMVAGAIFTWGALSKITGLMVGLPAIYMMLTILRRQKELSLRRLVPIAVAGTISLVPVVAYYLWAKHLASSYPPYHFAGSGNWIWVKGIGAWLEELYYLPELFQSGRYWLWTPPVAILAAIGIIAPSFRARSSQPAPWTFHWWLFAAGLYYFIGARELVDNPWNFHIFNPAVAALAGQGIVAIVALVAAVVPPMLPEQSVWHRHAKSAIAIFCITAAIATITGVGHVRLKSLYARPYGQESYELGLMLRAVSEPDDLVVTMASDIGDPNVIYYSRRRGWTFPPASNDIDWSRLPEDDADSIRMFEDLQSRGAAWLAIARERQKDFWTQHPQLVEYVEGNFERQSEGNAGWIYRMQRP